MAHYLVQLTYTPEAWAAQLKSPASRVEAVQPVMDKLGARFESVYLAFGEYDVVFFMEAPDNVTAAAVSLAFTSGGAIKAIKTTPLLTIEEGIEAMRKGAEGASMYQPPR